MAKLESQLINLVFFLIFLPFNFLDCLRQHNNCGSLGRTVAFLFELLPYAKGEGGLWKDKLDSTPPTRDSSPSTRFPGEESVPHPESLDQACLHHPPTGRTSLAVHGSFDCRWYVHRGGFIPGLNPQDNFYLEGGKGSSSSLQNCHWSDNSEGRKNKHVIGILFSVFEPSGFIVQVSWPLYYVTFGNTMRGKTPRSLLEKLFEVYSCTPYSGKTLGFRCWVLFSLLSKDCEFWPVLNNQLVFQGGHCLLEPKACLAWSKNTARKPSSPAPSWPAAYLPCPFSVSTMGRWFKFLWLRWARLFHMTNQAAADLLSEGRANSEALL